MSFPFFFNSKNEPPDWDEREVRKLAAAKRRMMAAEEASLNVGLFGRILRFYERWMRRSLRHPVLLFLLCVVFFGVLCTAGEYATYYGLQS